MITAILMPAMIAAMMVNGATGDFAVLVSDTGAGVASAVTTAVGRPDPCSGVMMVVTGSVPSPGTTDMTVPKGTFSAGLLTVTVYCPGPISLWKP